MAKVRGSAKGNVWLDSAIENRNIKASTPTLLPGLGLAA